ncbi:MAG: hypothetical protein FWC71_10985 [Defluviitaleaceae bacterium]|nr:hypothetical protein [Defluviitaleaceae bacterium]
MEINNFIERVNNANWQKYDNGINSFAQTVPQTLIDLARVDQESDELLDLRLIERLGESRANMIANAPIGSNLLFAIGNDHAGSYYAVAQVALPFIIEVALYGNHIVARTCAINCLIDLYHFESEDGLEVEKYVREQIKEAINVNKENFTSFFASDKRNNDVMIYLFEITDEA